MRMKAKFPFGDSELKIGILGMTEGNGHPYSWSAMFNGFHPERMKSCPFPVIPVYLAKQPKSTIGIPGAHITHIHCDRRADAEDVAASAFIPHIADKPEDMIGQIDAVIVATDIGSEHVRRCRPFVDAGVPVFVDKPLADNEDDLQTFSGWHADGAPILSSSSMRYWKEAQPYHNGRTHELGELRYVSALSPKKWETYGIHQLELIYPIVGPGFESIQNTGTYERNILHIRHGRGIDINIALIKDMFGGGDTLITGTTGHTYIRGEDSYHCFKTQLDTFVKWLRDGIPPYPFSETQELMKLVIGGIRSREEHGRPVMLSEIREK